MKTVKDDVQITVRVERELKDSADSLFHELGMNMTTAVNMFLRKAVCESGIPFPVMLRNQPFVAGYTEEDIQNVFQRAVSHEISNKFKNGNPVVEYDREKKQVYLHYPDGKREYVND